MVIFIGAVIVVQQFIMYLMDVQIQRHLKEVNSIEGKMKITDHELDSLMKNVEELKFSKPDLAAGWNNQGAAPGNSGQYSGAGASRDGAHAIHPHDAGFWHDRGLEYATSDAIQKLSPRMTGQSLSCRITRRRGSTSGTRSLFSAAILKQSPRMIWHLSSTRITSMRGKTAGSRSIISGGTGRGYLV